MNPIQPYSSQQGNRTNRNQWMQGYLYLGVSFQYDGSSIVLIDVDSQNKLYLLQAFSYQKSPSLEDLKTEVTRVTMSYCNQTFKNFPNDKIKLDVHVICDNSPVLVKLLKDLRNLKGGIKGNYSLGINWKIRPSKLITIDNKNLTISAINDDKLRVTGDVNFITLFEDLQSFDIGDPLPSAKVLSLIYSLGSALRNEVMRGNHALGNIGNISESIMFMCENIGYGN